MSAEQSVVVGVDDRPGSELALRWAVTEARARAARLRIVCAYQWVRDYGWYGTDALDAETVGLRLVAERVVETMTTRALTWAPGLAVDGAAITGTPVKILLTESKAADVVVVGSRRLKALGAAVLGSVGGGLAARAHSPVVVVRAPAGDPAGGAAVVVGVDGRDAGISQLAYAFEHAGRHGVQLRAVLCWPPDPFASARWLPDPPSTAAAQAWFADSLAGWQERYPRVRVQPTVIRQHPIDGLVAESHGAHLLVVGARGRHAITGMLLGSVSQGVLHHAACPVAVVPDTVPA